MLAAQARAAEQAGAEVLRLQESLQFAVPALSAIGDSARRLSRYSARVRVLELEVLPAGPYLGHCVRVAARRARRSAALAGEWSARMTARVDEIEVMLERAIEITASIDVPGELGLPLELVSTVQSGARAGLACLGRLRSILEEHDAATVRAELRAGSARAAAQRVGAVARPHSQPAAAAREPGPLPRGVRRVSCSRWPRPEPAREPARARRPAGRRDLGATPRPALGHTPTDRPGPGPRPSGH